MIALACALPLGALAQDDPSSLEARLRALLDHPDALPGLRVKELVIREDQVSIGLEIPPEIPLDDLDPIIEGQFEIAVGAITAAHSAEVITLKVAHPGGVLAPPPRKRSLRPGPRIPPSIAPDPTRFPDGQSLRGKTIAISPGHGYIFYSNLNAYSTQRGRVSWTGCGDCRGIVEDFETHEIVVRHLVPLLEGAGARVILLRDRSYQGVGAISDQGDGAAFHETSGTFSDVPQGHAGALRRSTSGDAAAEWTIRAPARGPALLTAWFVGGAGHRADAALEVLGPFGSHRLLFDQTRHGQRWAPIGLLDLDRDQEITVRLSAPPGAAEGAALDFDAIRIGAGRHSSNHPWWQMGAQPFAAYQSAPAAVRDLGDVTARPVYAEWFDADVYLSLHSNASGQTNSTAAGTSSYRYSCGTLADHATAPPAATCDDPTGSARLQETLHRSFIEALRAEWDPNWLDRGPRVANFGELRALDDMPGVLLESAFHDQMRLADGSTLRMTDNQALHDPRWRRAAAFGLYRGLSEFLVGPGPLVVGPPKAAALVRVDWTRLELRFTPVPGATGYRVYVAQGGRAFDQGRIVSGSPAMLEGLAAEAVTSIRIASLNAAGEGLPSKVVSARPSGRRSQVLLVDAFDREDAWVQDIDNRHDTSLIHAEALAARDHAFDGATEAGWAAGFVRPSDYDGLMLAFGRESTADEILTVPLRAEVSTFAAAGGAVWADGSEIAWALDAQGDSETRAFLGRVFGARMAGDDAASPSLQALPSGPFGTVTGTLALEDGTGVAMQAFSSDVLTASVGATPAFAYADGRSLAGVSNGDNLLLGFALDSLVDPAARAAIASAWVEAIPIEPLVPMPDGGARVDAGFDGGVLDTGAIDAGAPPRDAEAEDASLSTGRLIAVTDPAITGGCACSATPPRRGEALSLGLLVVLGLLARRRALGRSRL